jgi:hypothetical protein
MPSLVFLPFLGPENMSLPKNGASVSKKKMSVRKKRVPVQERELRSGESRRCSG